MKLWTKTSSALCWILAPGKGCRQKCLIFQRTNTVRVVRKLWCVCDSFSISRLKKDQILLQQHSLIRGVKKFSIKRNKRNERNFWWKVFAPFLCVHVRGRVLDSWYTRAWNKVTLLFIALFNIYYVRQSEQGHTNKCHYCSLAKFRVLQSCTTNFTRNHPDRNRIESPM